MSCADTVVALNDLLADYWERVDRVVEDLVTDLFTDDGEMQIGTLYKKGREQIEAWHVERRAGEDQTSRRTRHSMSNLRFAFEGDDTATARFQLIVFSGRGTQPFASAPPSNVADARTKFQKVDGRWLIDRFGGSVVMAGPDAPPNAR